MAGFTTNHHDNESSTVATSRATERLINIFCEFVCVKKNFRIPNFFFFRFMKEIVFVRFGLYVTVFSYFHERSRTGDVNRSSLTRYGLSRPGETVGASGNLRSVDRAGPKYDSAGLAPAPSRAECVCRGDAAREARQVVGGVREGSVGNAAAME